jgi:RNA polymerase sigma-70 factor (ECF subfamily)
MVSSVPTAMAVERAVNRPALSSELAASTQRSPDVSRALDDAMSRYAEGDDAAFSRVFSGLAPRLHAFLRRLGGTDDLASDLTQETFLRMHRARGTFVPGNRVVPWAYAIARNCFVSHTRSPRVKASRSTVDIADHDAAAGLDASAEETAATRQSAELVERTLAAMSAANREAFVLIRFEGLSVAEAAEILGASEGAVKLRAFRAYELLREALKRAETGATKRATEP